MYRKAFVFLLLICIPVLLFSQEYDDPDDPSGDSEWDYYDQDVYVSGDQTFIMSLGTVFPVVFMNNGEKLKPHNFTPAIGGGGSLAYNYYFNSYLFVGGEIGGLFMPTLAENTAYIINLGARTGFQFNIRQLEFPLSVVVGMSWHRYLSNGYYGFFIKGGIAGYYRFNSEWSFGLNFNWAWLPEWTKDSDGNRTKDKDVNGNVIELTLSARYHF